MAAPAYVGGSNGGSFASAFTLTKPAGVAAGDTLIVSVAHESTMTVSMSGWTLIEAASWGGTYDARHTLFSKVAGSSEPASYTVTPSANNGHTHGVLVAYSGVQSVGSPSATSYSNTFNLSAPAIATAVDESVVLHIYAQRASGDSSITVNSPDVARQARTARTPTAVGEYVQATAGTAPASSATSSSQASAGRAVSIVLAPSVPADPGNVLTLAGVAAVPTSSFVLDVAAPPVDLTLAGTAAAPLAAFVLDSEIVGGDRALTLAGVARTPTAAFALTSSNPSGGTPANTVTTNRANGIQIRGMGFVESDPPVVEIPTRLVRGHDYVKAQAYVAPTMDAGRPVDLDVDEAATPADRDRILVGGKDVTYFRDAVTPTPSFLLTEPFAYGSTTLVFPQTHAVFEQPGTGPLRWLRKEARVRIQRVGPNGGVVGTDYIGVITALRVQGRSWVADVGGDLAGRAAMRDRQPPLFRWVRDIGRHAHVATREMGLRFSPRFGPTTGIDLVAGGGMRHLDWLNHVCAMAVKQDGTHYTLMPTPGNVNVWEFRAKDRTTRHATVYFDDARIVPDLTDDLMETPNRVFATGVTPEGLRVKNGVYPGLKQSAPAGYPYTDGRSFGVGTTDADVDTLDSITAMNWKLIGTGYLSREDLSDTYTSDTESAVIALQEDANLTASGTMNGATWDALFDLTTTGFSIRQSEIMPMAQRNYVRPWNRTANGSRSSRNPAYDPTRLVVDRTVDFGAPHERQQMRNWARRELTRTGGKTWAGTIRVNLGALVRGDHTPGAPLTAADVMPLRELRPGMNVWAPLFDGGTLFHIAGIDVDAGGRTGTLTVDTHARDLLPVAEIVARNRESRRNPARAFLDQHRSSKQVKDAIVPFDEVGGRIWSKVECPAGQWTVFPVVAGQEGTVRKLDMQTSSAPAEFAVSVWGKDPGKATLDKRLPTPLVLDADGMSVWEEDRDLYANKVLLYAAGTEEEPCGYWPRRHTNDKGETTAHPITGRWVDDAQFSYHTIGAPVLYVAIWPTVATTLRAQRIMWPQLEEGS